MEYKKFITRSQCPRLHAIYFAINTDTEQGFKTMGLDLLFKKIDDPRFLSSYKPLINYYSPVTKICLDNGYPDSNCYNHPDYISLSNSKVNFHKILHDCDNVPKTVFDAKRLGDLKFPIIAKPDKGHSGIGISIIKSKEDLVNYDLSKYNLFSEFISHKEEFRVFSFKGEIIFCMQRIPLNDKAKTGTGDRNEQMEFVYTKINPYALGLDVITLIEETHKKFKGLEFLCFDLMRDNDDKLFIIETNSQPGLPFDSLVELYRACYIDFYGKIDIITLKALEDISKKLIDYTLKNNSKQFQILT